MTGEAIRFMFGVFAGGLLGSVCLARKFPERPFQVHATWSALSLVVAAAVLVWLRLLNLDTYLACVFAGGALLVVALLAE